MTVQELIGRLQRAADAGHGLDHVRVIDGDGSAVGCGTFIYMDEAGPAFHLDTTAQDGDGDELTTGVAGGVPNG